MDEPLSTRHPDWKFRLYELNGEEVWVPNYIVRIDNTGRAANTRTRGWQVRYKTPSTFFSDFLTVDADATTGDAHASLAMAIAYLSSIWEGKKTKGLSVEERSGKKVNLGIPGVTLRFRKRNNGKGSISHVCELRIRSVTGAVLRDLYVGVVNNISLKHLVELVDSACTMRINHLLEEGFEAPDEPKTTPYEYLKGTPLEHLIQGNAPKVAGPGIYALEDEVGARHLSIRKATQGVALNNTSITP